jgi:hypothetical protein
MKMAKTGGPPIILFDHTEDNPIGIAVGPKDVYWWPSAGASMVSGALWKVGKDGTGAQPIGTAGSQGAYALQVDEHAVYGVLDLSNQIVRLDFAGGPPIHLADVEAGPRLALDDTRVFFTSSQGIHHVDKDGSAPTWILDAKNVRAMLVDATWVYYVSEAGIRRMTKLGAEDEILVAAPPGAGSEWWMSAVLAQDDRALYFTSSAAVGGSASIEKIAK